MRGFTTCVDGLWQNLQQDILTMYSYNVYNVNQAAW